MSSYIENALSDIGENGRHRCAIICDVSQPDHLCDIGFFSMTGYSEIEVFGRNCRFLQGPDTNPETVARLRDAVAARESIEVEILNYTKNGDPFWNLLKLRPLQASQPPITRMIGIQQRIEKPLP